VFCYKSESNSQNVGHNRPTHKCSGVQIEAYERTHEYDYYISLLLQSAYTGYYRGWMVTAGTERTDTLHAASLKALTEKLSYSALTCGG
jgi:hypothetical protein